MRARFTLSVGVTKPFSGVHGAVMTAMQSSFSCGSRRAFTAFKCAASESIRAVRPVLEYLQRFEVVPWQAPDAVLGPVDVMLDRFWRYLTVERALAAVTARAVLGFFCTNSAVVPSTFSGWSFQMSWVVMAVTPMPSMMAR